MHELDLNANGSERLRYNAPGLPVRTRDGALSLFADYAAACHWHRDLELLLVLEGEMCYSVSGERVRLRAGEAVFVNAGRLHYGFSADRRESLYRFVVFHPSLLGDSPEVARAVADLCAEDRADWLRITGANAAEARVLELLRGSRACGERGDPLALLSLCAELTALVARLLPGGGAPCDESWELLRRMTGHIQLHYAEHVLLEEIAAAAPVCRSRCCGLFREKLGCTPLEYLTRYRLDKACAQIARGASITEAALSCGFGGASYFAEVFRRSYGLSPREYRAACRARAGEIPAGD